ncbi:MAG: hypothetical protein ABSB74_08595 [Tepidisphaeraceae bacterium]
MSGLLKNTLSAALSLVLGLALNHANGASVNLQGGDPTALGGWQITPDPAVTASGISVNGQTLVIQNEAMTVTGANPQGITFTQVSANAVPFIEIATETIGNSTGSDWTSFAFSLSGSAAFDGISNVFVPPFGTGVNYTTVDLSIPRTLVTYTGSQLNGATSNWGSSNPGDDLLIDGNPAATDAFPSFSLDQSPQGFVSEVIPAPLAAWQSLVALLALACVPALRRAVKVFA